MSRKRDHVFEDYYKPFDPSNRNYVNERVALIEAMVRRTLSEMCMARFEWKNLPESVNERFLELTLHNKGTAVFFKDPNVGYLALAGTPAATLNMYGDPLGFLATGMGSYGSKMLQPGEFEPIYSNALRRTDWDIINVYAPRLAQTDRTLEINTQNARQTGFAAIPENMLLSFENMLVQMEEGQRFIKVKGGEFGKQMLDAISTFDMQINPDSFDRMHVLRVRWYNECLGLLGIDNTNQDKKERLVEAEVDGNADQIAATRRVNLNQRQDAAERISKHWNLNPPITVDYYKPPMPEAPPGEGPATDSESSAPPVRSIA
jgi:hypothetical protein